MSLLNEREQEIFDFINLFITTKGYPPSVREIGAAIGLKSSSTVHKYLATLENKGFLRRDLSKPRALEIFKNDTKEEVSSSNSINNEIFGDNKPIVSSSDVIGVPLLGKVAAGYPIFAEENVEEYVPLPSSIAGDEGTSYMLEVVGQSMIGAGIFDGDYVIVKKQNIARNGEIVVALLEDEATVKRIFIEKEYIRLEPENPAFAPIITQEVKVIGKVIGLIRKLN